MLTIQFDFRRQIWEMRTCTEDGVEVAEINTEIKNEQGLYNAMISLGYQMGVDVNPDKILVFWGDGVAFASTL